MTQPPNNLPIPQSPNLQTATAPLLPLLSTYLTHYPAEAQTVAKVRDLVETHPDAFYRTCAVGHITGSAWIVSVDRQHCLLTHHRKLDRWLQVGGHVDGEQEVHLAALREAREESGLTTFTIVEPGGQLIPFDIDIHPIPAKGQEPHHQHYDLRYLLIAEPDQPLKISSESNDLRWFGWEEVQIVTQEAGIRRMVQKARLLLGV